MEKRKKLKGRVFKVLLISLSVILIGIIACAFMINCVDEKGVKNIISFEEISDNEVDAIIVLGAGVKEDGSPCQMLEDRLKTAIAVYNKLDKKCKILLSGDHGQDNYNEVKTMKKYILDNLSISESDIFMDHAGFSTYDTMYRAKDIFEVNKAIVITNEYHLPRALYLAQKKNIEVLGVASDLREYSGIDYYKFRERFSQIKAFLMSNITKSKPKFLGEKIPISSSDGRITEDGK
ncbi:MAG: ElyC/SanA/YdcF family protein [Clostridium sp.]|nr:ElyC/SanA/YdcF family protein [Clostridium sp.]